MNWLGLKNEAAHMLLEKDALHIYGALIVQVGAARIFRRTLGHGLPWLCVLGVELINEFLDVILGEEAQLMPWQVVSAAHDILNTMILPTVLLLLCRRAPRLLSSPTAPSKVELPPHHSDG
jgi:hypothetical protein